MDPQQELFAALLIKLREQYAGSVYDGFLPPAGTAYPFVYLADSYLTDEPNKTAIFGSVEQRIHVWHNDPRKRGTVSQMLLKIKEICRHINHTSNFGWSVSGVDQQILSDDTTGTPLVHGVLIITFRFS